MWTWHTRHPRGVVVIVHGLSEHHGRYEWLIQQFLAADYHVVMGDLPGQGLSTGRRGHISSFTDYIDVLSAWLDTAFAYQLPVYVVGHSLGGLISIHTMIQRRPAIQAWVVSSPCLGIMSRPPNWLRTLTDYADPMLASYRVRIKKHSYNSDATRNKQQLARDARDPLMVKKVSFHWYNELEKAIEEAFRDVDHVPDSPLMVMQAGDDKIVDKIQAYQWYERLTVPDKTYKEWPGLYHELFNEPERETVFSEVLAFLQRHEP